MKLRVIELFAGIGAQAAALDLIGAEWESVNIVEVDPYCVTSYNAIHGTDYKPSDITKVERLPECDLLTYSFPCTDISNAGKQKGLAEGSGTRSSLLWEVYRLLKAYTVAGGVLTKVPFNGKCQGACTKEVQAVLRRLAQKAGRAGLYELLESAQRHGLRHPTEQRKSNSRFHIERRRRVRIPSTETTTVKAERYTRTRSRRQILHKRGCGEVETGKSLLPSESIDYKGGVSRTLTAREYKEPTCVALSEWEDEGAETTSTDGTL